MKKYIFFAILLSISLNIYAQNSEPAQVAIPSLYGSPSPITIENYYSQTDSKLKQTTPIVGWHWEADFSISNALFCTQGMGGVNWKNDNGTHILDPDFELSGNLKQNIGYFARHQINTRKAYSIGMDYDPSTIKSGYNAFYQCEGCNDDPVKPKVFGFTDFPTAKIINRVPKMSLGYVTNGALTLTTNDVLGLTPSNLHELLILQNPWPQFLPNVQNIDMTSTNTPKYVPIFGRNDGKPGYEDTRKRADNIFF